MSDRAISGPAPASADWPSNSPLVAVCILNWNGWRDTLECVESLRKQDYPNFAMVVLDNGSLNDSAEQIRAWARANLAGPSGFADYSGRVARLGGEERSEHLLQEAGSTDRLVLISNEENTGFTGGCNTVFDYVLHRKFPADYVFLLNNDASLAPDCLTSLMAVANETGAGVIGAVMFNESGEEPVFNGRISMKGQFFYPFTSWQLPPPAAAETFWASDCAHGGAKVVRADVLRAVRSKTGRYFREGLFMYHEGAEFHHQAAALGFRTVVAKRAVVYHKNARSSGGTENPIAYYYSERNRILVANVVLPLGSRLLFHVVNAPVVSARVLKNVVRGRWVAACAVLEGFVDAYRGRQGKWRRHDQCWTEQGRRSWVQGAGR